MRLRLRLDRLREMVDRGRISQNHWAIKLGLSRGHWSDLLNGKHPYPSQRTRERLVEVFGVAEADLFLEEDGTTTPDDAAFRRAVAARFQFLDELGRGGTGAVFAAHDMRLGRLVALKVVQPEAVAGVGTDQLLQEVTHVAQLHHPNILPLFDAGIEAGQPYLVMPLIREGSLRAFLRNRGSLSTAETIALLEGIARGLDHAHSRQTLHCDIKPENILVQDGHPMLMDFGIARRLHAEAEEWSSLRREIGYSAGTPAYVSPEQAAGDREIGPRSDIYSLACVAYEMLTGNQPFDGTSTREIVTRRFRTPPAPVRELAPDVPQSVADVVARAMSIDPELRPPTARQFVTELRAAASGASRLSYLLVRNRERTLAAIGYGARARARSPLAGVSNDMRYLFRSLRRDWRFALSVVLSIGLGLGVGLPSLGLADHLLLRPPPGINRPGEVFQLIKRVSGPQGTFDNLSLTGLDYSQLLTHMRTVSGISAYSPTGLSTGLGSEARPISAQMVSASFFDVLGVRMQAGRTFTDAEDIIGATAAPAVISHRYWQREYAGATDALGQTLRIGDVDYTIVGITPPDFNGLSLSAVDVYLPLRVTGTPLQGNPPDLWTSDGSAWLRLIARLNSGVTVATAEAEANQIYRLPGSYRRDPERTDQLMWQSIIPGRAMSRQLNPSRQASLSIWLSGGAVLLLALIAANLANLFSGRAAAHSRETAIRIAIGGGTRQLLQLRMGEALLLAAVGATIGIALSVPGTALIRATMLPAVTWHRPAIDLRLIGLAMLLTLLTAAAAIATSLVRSMRTDPGTLLRSGGRALIGSGFGVGPARTSMLLVQAMVFAALLCLSIAFVASLRRAANAPFGFEPDRLTIVGVPRLATTNTFETRRLQLEQAREQLLRVGGVEGVAMGYMVPWQNNAGEDLWVPGVESQPPRALYDIATPEYLATTGMRLRAGRWIEAGDVEGAEPIMVINEELATQVWPGESAIGRCIRVGNDSLPCRTVVGVVGNTKVTGGINDAPTPVYYLPVAQGAVFSRTPTLFVRSSATTPPLVESLRAAVQGLSPDLGLVRVTRLADNLTWFTGPLRTGTLVFSVFGVLAAVIATIGLSGVLGFIVTQTRQALAVRLALGAQRTQIVRPVLIWAVTVVGIGMLAGFLVLSLFRNRMEPLLHETRLFELPTVLGVLAFGAVITVLAALVPVQQVLRLQPMRVLREE